MCLAVPGELIRIEHRRPAGLAPDAGGDGEDNDDDPLWRVGVVEFSGVQREVSLACVPEARPGDLLLVHVGFALSVMVES
ncbi:HypC/HybG/HupF family hydrogenase formation chaperone [Synechococcus sp. Lug-A]|uniref:HypC/HybG/HupF family hydrogenase formation chaperone n=1 Tax=Synechococcus sp. Lug-A TaxID=2823740 RepID=UPI0020CC1BB7|nr:HypC/HybG/HupF family hydrogenase formation chaperone [Synechococcus sp. Lug-A]MCP9846334.1 HypC/HybG/HupF family hydrogenase formation chaperone [Synechococcus sp. Lug-A]